MLRRTWAVALSTLLLLTAAVACNGDSSGEGEPSPTVAPATATGTPAPSVRDVDFAAEPAIVDFMIGASGELDESRNVYADLTGDGTDEAIVPVASGGEGGNIAVFVFRIDESGELEELLRARPAETGMTVDVENGQLVTEEGDFAPGDPFGVPSLILRRYYTWDGEALVVDREERVSAR